MRCAVPSEEGERSLLRRSLFICPPLALLVRSTVVRPARTSRARFSPLLERGCAVKLPASADPDDPRTLRAAAAADPGWGRLRFGHEAVRGDPSAAAPCGEGDRGAIADADGEAAAPGSSKVWLGEEAARLQLPSAGRGFASQQRRQVSLDAKARSGSGLLKSAKALVRAEGLEPHRVAASSLKNSRPCNEHKVLRGGDVAPSLASCLPGLACVAAIGSAFCRRLPAGSKPLRGDTDRSAWRNGAGTGAG